MSSHETVNKVPGEVQRQRFISHLASGEINPEILTPRAFHLYPEPMPRLNKFYQVMGNYAKNPQQKCKG
jgi:hypothetical protein